MIGRDKYGAYAVHCEYQEWVEDTGEGLHPGPCWYCTLEDYRCGRAGKKCACATCRHNKGECLSHDEHVKRYFESIKEDPGITAAFRQIGNAVPVRLAYSVACALKDSIERKLNIYTHIERYGIDLTPHYMYQECSLKSRFRCGGQVT